MFDVKYSLGFPSCTIIFSAIGLTSNTTDLPLPFPVSNYHCARLFYKSFTSACINNSEFLDWTRVMFLLSFLWIKIYIDDLCKLEIHRKLSNMVASGCMGWEHPNPKFLKGYECLHLGFCLVFIMTCCLFKAVEFFYQLSEEKRGQFVQGYTIQSRVCLRYTMPFSRPS